MIKKSKKERKKLQHKTISKSIKLTNKSRKKKYATKRFCSFYINTIKLYGYAH